MVLCIFIVLCSVQIPFAFGVGYNLLPGTNECGLLVSDEKIVGGDEIPLGEEPWTALLYYRYVNESSGKLIEAPLCGGVLINHRYVLTAAHCVSKELFSVALGEHNVTTDPDCEYDICAPKVLMVEIKEKIVHEFYANSSNFPNDIALLRLKQYINYTEFVKPICIPTAKLAESVFKRNIFFVVGWGVTENGFASEVKLRVKIPISNQTACPSKIRLPVTVNQICAGGEKGRGGCNGDSGGALTTLIKSKVNGRLTNNMYSIGVVSLGPRDCGAQGYPGVFTAVADYSDWIIKHLKE